MDNSSGYEQPAGTQVLGAVVWPPPAFIVERSLAFRKRSLRLAFSLQVAMVPLAGLGVLGVQAGVDAGWALAGGGVLLLFVSIFPWARGIDAGTVWFAVLEKGVLMPSSFTNLPGLSRFGGPCVLAKSEITSASELVQDGARAIIVTRADGQAGLVSARVGEVDLSAEEQADVLAAFAEALERLGVKVGRDGTENDDAEGPTAGA